jgi:hypothetical protein
LYQGNSFPRGIVGETEKNHIGAVQKFRAFGGVFSFFWIYQKYFNVVPFLQALVNFKPGRAFLAVHEYFEFFHMLILC